MRLKRIKLNSDFRSLKSGFEFDFLYEKPNSIELNPYCVVGRNGSGKSNILELLSSIFYNLELRCLDYLPEIFQDEKKINLKKQDPNAYELEYFLDGDFISIVKNENEFANVYKNGALTQSKSELKSVMPHYVVSYSSGENQILSIPFFKMRFIQFDEYMYNLAESNQYVYPENRMIYLDDEYFQAILLSVLLFENNLIEVLEHELGIKSIRKFRIYIRKEYLEDEYGREVLLTDSIEHYIDRLKQCATLTYENDSLYIFDFFVDGATKKAFEFHFENSLNLFSFFQILTQLNNFYTDELIKNELYQSPSLYAVGKVATVPWRKKIFVFEDYFLEKDNHLTLSKSLSDGEYQFLHTLGIALLFKNTSSLFLFDEPETHFNPDWRAKYISVLKKCFEGDNQTPEVLISSHSPFIVSDTKEDNVLNFEKDENGMVSCKKADFNTFGASVNKITMKVFGKKETIGDVAKYKLTEYEKRLESDQDIDAIIHDIDLELGESVEKILFMKMLFDKQESK
jgi:restriction system-associated AAA family ATPase